jgi:hypothetical protein
VKNILIQPRSGIVAIEGYFKFEHIFSVNILFPYPLATALLIGDVMINRRSGVKMFLSVITAPIVLAQLIYFLFRRYYVNPSIHPANLIRHAYSRCEYALLQALTLISGTQT